MTPDRLLIFMFIPAEDIFLLRPRNAPATNIYKVLKVLNVGMAIEKEIFGRRLEIREFFINIKALIETNAVRRLRIS